MSSKNFPILTKTTNKKGVAIDKEATSLLSKKKEGTAVELTTPLNENIPQDSENVKKKRSDRNAIPLSERFDSSRKDIRYSNRKPYRNISEEEYDTFLRKKPIKASKKDIAKVAAERRSLYSKLESEEEIPDIDIFQLAEYNEVNVGYVYVVHNFDHERFWIIKKSKIKPDVKSVIKERSNRNNDRKTNDTLNRQVATVENGRGSDRGGLLDNRNEKTVQRNAESTGSNDKSDATGNLDKSSSDSRAGIKRQDRDLVGYERQRKIAAALAADKAHLSEDVETRLRAFLDLQSRRTYGTHPIH